MTTHLAHMPLRPGWQCRWCHEPWPCELERQRLLAELIYSPTALYMYMAGCLCDAAGDLPDLPAGELWARFLGWVRAAAHATRDPSTP